MLHKLLTTMLPCLLMLGCTATGGDSARSSSPSWDGEVQVHGALRDMFHKGQTGPMVALEAMLPNPTLYGVGALASLSGEVTVIGGKVYLSYPDADTTRTEVTRRTAAGATLFVAAEVPGWQGVSIKRPIRFEELDERIAELAAEAGMSLDRRFPFLLEGDFEDLQWHVIDGRRLVDGGTSHEDHRAAAVKARLDRASAILVGFYSQHDQGVFTHMGSRTHIHCVLPEPLAAGHVDHVIIPPGTTVKFPVGGRERPDTSDHSANGDGI